jgi:hypothetical protein
MLLACCSHNADFAAPLAVDQPTVCEDVLTPPQIPAVGPDDDAIGAFLQNRAVAIVAVATIVAGRDCIRDQRQLYSGKEAN